MLFPRSIFSPLRGVLSSNSFRGRRSILAFSLTFFIGMTQIYRSLCMLTLFSVSCLTALVSCAFHLAADAIAISRHVHDSLARKGFEVLVPTAKIRAGRFE